MLLYPLALAYKLSTDIRNELYRRQFLKSYRLPRPVVSVGNLTVGGTGKTPFVEWLLHWCQEQKIAAGVVSRGYGARFHGVQRVPSQTTEVGILFGDEPHQIASRFSDIPVYVCPDRLQAGAQLLADCPQVQLVVADDAFQHRKLRRDLDIVLIDTTQSLSELQVLPQGRLRESFANVARADFIILNKINLSSPQMIEQLKVRLRQALQGLYRPILSTTYEWRHLRYHLTGKTVPSQNLNQHLPRALLLSGVAKPGLFSDLAKHAGLDFFPLSYSDHYAYQNSDCRQISATMKQHGCEIIVTSAKDEIKLKQFKELTDKLWVAEVEMRFIEPYKEFTDALLRLVR